MFKKILVIGGLAGALFTAGCSNSDDTIVIGGKPWTEQYILPQIVGQYIEANSDLNVKYKEGLGSTGILHPALQNGEIDIYVEYTGTGLGEVLKYEDITGITSDEAYDRVVKGYEETQNSTWMPRLGFENSYVIATREDYNANNLTELAQVSQEESLIFGSDHAYYERPVDGYDELLKTYSFKFSDSKTIDPNIMYDAVKNGDVDIITAFTTDARIKAFNLKTYEDDKLFFPKYEAAPVVNNDTLKAHPELEELLAKLENVLTNELMMDMNARVDAGEKAEDVAREFLKDNGLIE